MFRNVAVVVFALVTVSLAAPAAQKEAPKPLDVNPKPLRSDTSVKVDYDIVYVRTPRKDDKSQSLWAEIFQPDLMDSGGDLVLLRPDGSEDVLVKGGPGSSVTDPYVSFDGEWVYYAHFRDLIPPASHIRPRPSADVYKIHVKSRAVVRLTHGEVTPNTGAADWSADFRTPAKGKSSTPYGVLNLGPCPLPGGKVMFTSNRNTFGARGLPALQLFVMDDPPESPPSQGGAGGVNVECIGHLNLGGALHPVILKDGRVIFSSMEGQGLRISNHWAVWSIHPDGTNWGPVVSAFLGGQTFHFQTQLSDESLVVEEYYLNNNHGFGTYWKLPAGPPAGYPAFTPAGGPTKRAIWSMPFTPVGTELLTRFATGFDTAAKRADPKDPKSPHVGKVTHPSGAPDNHLLTVWSPGPAHKGPHGPTTPAVDGGIYLIKDGKPLDEPGQMLLIKNDPKYNEQWPRALVPYKRIYGIDEPKNLPRVQNDGKNSPHLLEGVPFGLVGTSSLYKRESFPGGAIPQGSVTATYPGKKNAYTFIPEPFFVGNASVTLNWVTQGADAGLYSNEDIHAIRILATEPTTDTRVAGGRRLYYNHATERLRILGEIPVRHFRGEPGASATGGQPLDPDGNPDTSFLAKIPADVAWTFQTLDKDGMVLNMAQTWHQVRPGEVRNNCGGCHAHSQQPTPFEKTAAASKDYEIFDLTQKTPLLTTKKLDESKRTWDAKDETGLRYVKGVLNVEYHRDVRPIFERSCVACHTQAWEKPAGNLVLDDDNRTIPPTPNVGLSPWPATYYRLAVDGGAKFGHKPVTGVWGHLNASRYIRQMQSRRSLLVWKIFGKRTDGLSNDDCPSEATPGDPKSFQWKGKPVDVKSHSYHADLDYLGSVMPPPEAVAGDYVGPNGQKVKVAPLSDEDRRTIVRWIDLGCPIDFDYDPKQPERRGSGWLLDDQRPTLALTYPSAGPNGALSRVLVGMHDYGAGLDPKSFSVTADFPLDGAKPGEQLAAKFKEKGDGVWELLLTDPIRQLDGGKLTVSVKDRQGNISRIDRVFSVGKTREGER
jgi:hypothetical protein